MYQGLQHTKRKLAWLHYLRLGLLGGRTHLSRLQRHVLLEGFGRNPELTRGLGELGTGFGHGRLLILDLLQRNLMQKYVANADEKSRDICRQSQIMRKLTSQTINKAL